MPGFLADARLGLRHIISSPGFAAAAILTVGLGIGANTAIFSLLNGYLFKPLPYRNGAALARIVVNVPKLRAEPIQNISLPIYRVVKARTTAFSATAFYSQDSSNMVAEGRAKHVPSVRASASLFDVLGVRPLLGRLFTERNMRAGNNRVVVISYALWRDSFGADPNIIGKTMRIDGSVRRIIGVLPKDCAFPDSDTALWLPYRVDADAFAPSSALDLTVFFIGSLRPGMSLIQGEAQVQHIVSRYIRDVAPAQLEKMARESGVSMALLTYRRVLLGNKPTMLWTLQAAVTLILLMTCVNVANLLLSRMLDRSHEFAMRCALGATRGVLARQLLAEALCVTMAGGLGGAALGWVGLTLASRTSFSTGNTIFDVGFDWRVGLFTLGTVFLATVIVTILPIRRLSKVDLQSALQEGSRSSGGGRREKRLRKALVIAELALATGSLAVAGLVLHSYINIGRVNRGFREDHVLLARLSLPPDDHPGHKALSNFYVGFARQVEALPGVQEAAMATTLPLAGGRRNEPLPLFGFLLPGVTPGSEKQPAALFNRVSQSYFRALGIPLLRGRSFNQGDAEKSTVIIDNGLARKYFPGINPVGQQLIVRRFGGERYTIVGVVPSIKYARLSTDAASTTVYFNSTEYPSRLVNLVIHTTLTPNSLRKPLQRLLAAADPSAAVFDVHTMRDQVTDSLRDKRTTMMLLLAFGCTSLVLATVGVYGVISYAVVGRRAEFGLRLALGALPKDVRWLVLKDFSRLLITGLLLGLGLAILCGYMLAAQLFAVSPIDPATLLGSAALLFIVTLASCFGLVQRATRVDPALAVMER